MSAAAHPTMKPPFSPRELARLTGDLADLLERETAALAAMRVEDAVRLKDEKARLTRCYRAAIEELRAGRAELASAAPAERAHLLEIATRLAAVIGENERALRAGRAAVERVVAAIAAAVRNRERRLSGYAPPRHTPPRAPYVGGLAFDHRL